MPRHQDQEIRQVRRAQHRARAREAVKRRCTFVLAVIASAAMAAACRADPCKAIPENGPAPSYLAPGRTFAGRAAPLYRGQPGYSPNLDGDGDGIACELYR